MDYIDLSKEISYALRHAPWEYELELDAEGWVPITQLLDALQCSEKWSELRIEDIKSMVDLSEKKRHEIMDNKIRAFYGHSVPIRIVKAESLPPQILYHGTANRFVDAIMSEGLLPGSRQYVHLSQEIDTAVTVGKRRDRNPVILVINAGLAYHYGIKFYHGNDNIWLADKIPAQFIKIM